ncbi:hypothetical protein [Hyalangium gracile]|uniref:hypothetical protein n=1 Tax=Hyalangium gracile TaxID=394092 RepID=UPI001CCF8F1A|nr:hypothetical protein [Hyalangium gracile]
MKQADPPRLLDPDSEASSSLRELLESARADEPTPAELASLAGKLGPLFTPPGGAPPSTPSPGSGSAPVPSTSGGAVSAAAGGLKAKVILGVAAVALAGASFQAGRLVERESGSAQRASVSERAVEAPAASRLAEAPAPVQLPEPARVSSPEVSREAPPAPGPSRTGAPAAVPSPKVGSRPAGSAQRREPAEAPAPSTPSAVPGAASVDEELLELEPAWGALRQGNAAAALSRAESHAARFPSGALSQEREVIAIDALVRLGRRAEAEARAEAFRARYPTSTHQVRIQGLLSGTER